MNRKEELLLAIAQAKYDLQHNLERADHLARLGKQHPILKRYAHERNSLVDTINAYKLELADLNDQY